MHAAASETLLDFCCVCFFFFKAWQSTLSAKHKQTSSVFLQGGFVFLFSPQGSKGKKNAVRAHHLRCMGFISCQNVYSTAGGTGYIQCSGESKY